MKAHAAYLDIQQGDREDLVTKHASLVKRLAYHLLARLPASVDVDDLIQDGMIGLLEAARQYQPDKGASFETYATTRIRGAMIDQMRRAGWAPRSVSKQLRDISEAMHVIENREGRAATAQEIANQLNISLDTYHEQLRDTSSIRLFSLEQVSEDERDRLNEEGDAATAPLNALLESDFKTELATQIANLPEREQLVMALYYDTGLNLKEIGEVLSVSESRVSQIHSQAMVRLRSRMGEWTQ